MGAATTAGGHSLASACHILGVEVNASSFGALISMAGGALVTVCMMWGSYSLFNTAADAHHCFPFLPVCLGYIS